MAGAITHTRFEMTPFTSPSRRAKAMTLEANSFL